MANVLFNRDTLQVSGLGRNPLPFEVEIQNVNVENLTKQVPFTVEQEKKDNLGYDLFYLAQDPLVIEESVVDRYESQEYSDEPVLVKVMKQIPLLNDLGEQVEYEVIDTIVHPATIDEETGEVITPEYTEEVGTGRFIKCYTTEEVEEHKRDTAGKLLYWHQDTSTVTREEEQLPLEITEEHAQYTEGLPRAFEVVTKYRQARFEEEPQEFTYEDIVKAKESQLVEGTFYKKASLYETMDRSLFSIDLASFNADLGFDFISIPAGGEVRTEKILMPSPSTFIGIAKEASLEGLEVRVGNIASDMQLLDRNSERAFSSEVADVYVSFKNPTTRRIDLYSFALMV